MDWLTSIIVLAVVVFITWLAISYQATLTDTSSQGHHEAAHSAHEEHTDHGDQHGVVNTVHTDASVEPDHSPVPEPAPGPAAAAVTAAPRGTPETAPVEPIKQDDLVIIEGIGPKLASVLQAAGIQTFAQLAEMEAEKIKDILGAADARLARIADPTSWPAQAKLAAAGDMEALKAFQDQLKGGRS